MQLKQTLVAAFCLLGGIAEGSLLRKSARQLEHHANDASNPSDNHTHHMMEEIRQEITSLQLMDPHLNGYHEMKMALMEEVEEVDPVNKPAEDTQDNDDRRLQSNDDIPSRGTLGVLNRGAVECRSYHDDAQDRRVSREYWDLNLEAGTTYVIEANRLEGRADLVAEVWLGRPTFHDVTWSLNLVAAGDDEIPKDNFGDPRITFTAPETGLYTLAISDFLSEKCDFVHGLYTHYGYQVDVRES